MPLATMSMKNKSLLSPSSWVLNASCFPWLHKSSTGQRSIHALCVSPCVQKVETQHTACETPSQREQSPGSQRCLWLCLLYIILLADCHVSQFLSPLDATYILDPGCALQRAGLPPWTQWLHWQQLFLDGPGHETERPAEGLPTSHHQCP